MTPAERNAVLEWSAAWHDKQASRAEDAARAHREAARAIRALKEQEPTT